MAPRTLVEQFLGSFVRIHVGFLEGDIDISIRMIPHDFLDGLDRFPHSSRQYVGATPTLHPRRTTPTPTPRDHSFFHTQQTKKKEKEKGKTKEQ